MTDNPTRTQSPPSWDDPGVAEWLQRLPVGMFWHDAAGNCLHANERACRLAGLQPREALGRGWMSRLHPDDVDRVLRGLRQAVASGLEYGSEHRFLWPDGTVVWVLCRIVPESNPDGGPAGFWGILIDLDAQKRELQQLRRARDHLSAVYRASPDMIFLHDARDRLLEVNDNALAGFGYTRREILSVPFSSLSPEGSDMERAARLLDSARAGEAPEFEWVARRRNGESFPVEVRLRAVDSAEPEAAGSVVAVVRDIAARKHAERALRESEEKYRSTMDASLAGIFLVQDGRYQYVNPAMARLFHCSRRELQEAGPPWDRVVPDQGTLVRELFTRTRPEETQDPFAMRCRRLDGTEFDALVWTKGIYFRGRPAAVGTVIDISRRVQAERALRESEARFQAMAANLPGAVMQARRVGRGPLEFTYVSEGASRLFEKPAECLLADSRALLEAIHPDDRGGFEPPEIGPLGSATEWQWEGRVLASDGRCKWFAWRATGHRPAHGQVVWDALVLEVTEKRLMQEELGNYRDRLRGLVLHMQQLQERERAHIAREIHDEFGSLLSALKMNLHVAAGELDSDRCDAAARLRTAGVLIDELVGGVRRLATELRPRVLDDLGLVAALQWQASSFEQRSGIACELNADDPCLELPEDVGTTFFRLFQETLTNVARHSGASRVQASVARDGPGVTLLVRDNGAGLGTVGAERPGSHGVLGMRERVMAHGGEFSIQTSDPRGTLVRAWIPIGKARDDTTPKNPDRR